MPVNHPRRWHGAFGSEAPTLDSLQGLLARKLTEQERQAHQAQQLCRRTLSQLADAIARLPRSLQGPRMAQARSLLEVSFASPQHLADNLAVLARAIAEDALVAPPAPQPAEVAS